MAKKHRKSASEPDSSFQPDYGHWIRRGGWNLEESAFLLLDIEPRIADEKFRLAKGWSASNPNVETRLQKMSEYRKLLLTGPFALLDTNRGHHEPFYKQTKRSEYEISYKQDPKTILKWAYKMKVTIPDGLKQAAEELSITYDSTASERQSEKVRDTTSGVSLESDQNSKSFSKFKKLRPEQSHRERCRGIASLRWSQMPDMTIADMIVSDEITTHGCEGKNYHEDVLRGWISDLCPNRSPGRREKQTPQH